MHECHNYDKQYTRRDFLSRTTLGLGAATLAALVNPSSSTGQQISGDPVTGILGTTHFPAKVKRVIYLLQSGAPSQLDLFDYKPALASLHGEELPPSVRGMQRLTGMTAGQKSFPMVSSPFSFNQYGDSGAWISNLMPHTAQVADELCFIHSMHTDAINHDPAITFLQSGSQQPGRPSMGSWLSWGLGSENANLPSFVVLVTKDKQGQPLYSRLWGNGFLPSRHQGVQFRAGIDPVLYLSNPPGISHADRERHIRALRELQEIQLENMQDPEIETKIAQYEMAFRMQTSVPEVTAIDDEPESTFALYGDDAREAGTFAANCLLARRLAERGVRFIQLYHQGWDHHSQLYGGIQTQARETDQASAALVMDLKQRGLLDDTLVIWGGEFGRTTYSQGRLTLEGFGRDHHPRCFSLWMTGGGIKKGISYGMTDELGYNIVRDPVHMHDFQATVLHLLGIDHERLTFRHQGRRFRLTDVFGHVVHDVLT
ncbi:MAG: DUF1501 domain-containing protein [Bacteroidetes bacterium]|nr:DUF1501 domain-containing protein [Bacteroidota bacterium]MCY4234574.1 DUF1501 domain-containing protein [Bacteroidota bacterium]